MHIFHVYQDEDGMTMTAPARDHDMAPATEGRALLGVTDAAEYLGVSERWLYDQIREGFLPAMYMARSWKIRPEQLDRFADSFSARTTADARRRGQVRRRV